MGDTLLGGGDGGYAAVPEHHGGTVVGEALAAAGVSHLFFLPGGHLAPVVEGCASAGIRLVGTRHESAAVFMAEAWARCTGEVGVAGVTAGPGFTNAVTGIANSQSTGIPTVVLGGRTPLGLRGKGAVQDCDQESVARVVAKWARTATTPEASVRSSARRCSTARSGRPGSAYLDLPTDVLTAPAEPFAATMLERAESRRRHRRRRRSHPPAGRRRAAGRRRRRNGIEDIMQPLFFKAGESVFFLKPSCIGAKRDILPLKLLNLAGALLGQLAEQRLRAR